MERATFGAGCFWGVEAAFRQVQGVTATGVGFMGRTHGNLIVPTQKRTSTEPRLSPNQGITN